MSVSMPCPACESGDHAQHVEAWNVREGLIGGASCPCKGDCKPPDLSAIFGAVNSSSDEKALDVVGIRSLRERQRGVAETDLITVKESEWERLHVELARTNQAIEDIRALAEKAFKTLHAPYKLTEFDFGHIDRALREIQRLSGLSEHQEEEK